MKIESSSSGKLNTHMKQSKKKNKPGKAREGQAPREGDRPVSTE